MLYVLKTLLYFLIHWKEYFPSPQKDERITELGFSGMSRLLLVFSIKMGARSLLGSTCSEDITSKFLIAVTQPLGEFLTNLHPGGGWGRTRAPALSGEGMITCNLRLCHLIRDFFVVSVGF